jgi:hypothetical protein
MVTGSVRECGANHMSPPLPASVAMEQFRTHRDVSGECENS